jgi:hypothetical protein
MDGLPVQDPVLMYDGDAAALSEAVEAYVAGIVGGGHHVSGMSGEWQPPGSGAPGVARSWAAGRPYRVGSGGRSVTVAPPRLPTDCPTCVRGLVGSENKKTARRCPVCAGTGRVVG